MTARLLAFVLAGALAASIAVNLHLLRGRQPACPLCSPPSAEEVQSCIECLALTPDQRAALLQECSSCCGDSSTFEPRIAALRRALLAAMRARPVDAAAVRALGKELAALRGEAIVAGVEAALRVRALLTPAQIATLEETLGTVEYR
jgi:Spy/CpxP family protein refolding chaperone